MANQFHWADYLVFALLLVISAAIGLVFGFIDRKKKSSHHFLLGGGDLHVFPVGMSLLASFISAIAVLGFSAEMYKFGTMYWTILISYVFSQGLTALVYAPFFHKLGVTCAYEYLQIRFSSSVRFVTSLIFSFQILLYMSVALYTPSLAIRQVTGIGLEISVVATGLICCLYTVVGGMKATVWIDTFQILVMLSGLILVSIMGALRIEGGFTEIYNRMANSGRIEFFDFNPNPLVRHTFWTLMIGGFFTNLSTYASSQNSIQRYMSVKKWTDASKAIMLSYVGLILVISLTCLSGVVAFANYYNCDLLSSNQVEKSEQILPFYVLELLGDLPGLPGLFIATVYSAALSTISASMNSLACVSITDFVKPGLKKFFNHTLSERIQARVTKILALMFGLIAIGLAYLCQYLPGQVLQLALSILGLLGGPVLGVISLGMFIPYANWQGALFGLITSVAINIWIGIGNIMYVIPKTKPFSIDGCDPLLNLTITTISVNSTSTDYLDIYNLSYLHYSTLAVLIVFIVGLIVSFITQTAGFENKKLDQKYYGLRFLCCGSKPYQSDKVIPRKSDIDLLKWYDSQIIELSNKEDISSETTSEYSRSFKLTDKIPTDYLNTLKKGEEKIIQNDLDEIRYEAATF